jgi:hypothetical protein
VSTRLDYQKIAGDLLFGSDTLDNSARGLFLEAVIMHALTQHEAVQGVEPRWRYAGVGWGPWDLQRGTGAAGDRVRFQVKAKAARQLWKPQHERPFEYNLGWRDVEKLPSYFDRDFPKEVYGECETAGHRCDFFLLVWHGPNLATGEMHKGDQQSNPENYDYFVVPSSELPGAKKVLAKQLFERYEPIGFPELAARLNVVADRFLETATS